MKKFLSIKQVTNTLSPSDLDIFKTALSNSEKRIDFIRVVEEIIVSKNEEKEVIELLDQMCSILYQKSVIRLTVLGKINYAEEHYLKSEVEMSN